MFRFMCVLFLSWTFMLAQDVAIVKKVSGKISIGSKVQKSDIIITKMT